VNAAYPRREPKLAPERCQWMMLLGNYMCHSTKKVHIKVVSKGMKQDQGLAVVRTTEAHKERFPPFLPSLAATPSYAI